MEEQIGQAPEETDKKRGHQRNTDALHTRRCQSRERDHPRVVSRNVLPLKPDISILACIRAAGCRRLLL
jgi:hypothetical protein